MVLNEKFGVMSFSFELLDYFRCSEKSILFNIELAILKKKIEDRKIKTLKKSIKIRENMNKNK